MSKRGFFLAGMRAAVPIGIGYFCVSFTLGLAARQAGMSYWEAGFMSLIVNTSAGEFAGLGIIASGASLWEMAISQVIINLRYVLMSSALTQKLSPQTPFFHRFLIGADVTDELFSLNISQKGPLEPFFFYGSMASTIPLWCLGTVFGVILGNIMPERLLSAMSMALYGMFAAAFVPPMKTSRPHLILVILAMLLGGFLYFIPLFKALSASLRIILVTLVVAGLGALVFPVKEAEDE